MESKPEPSSNESKQPATNVTPSRAEAFDFVTIPDHQLLRCIGRGSYGTVLLARNSLGAYRAVKIVYRKSFSDQRPFERELSGIRKFEPVSRSHEGFVDVLHVGINEAEGYFYYVMELGDDCVSGQNFDPYQYIPKTLAKEISKRGALGVKDCLQLGLALSDALAELHRCGLVHRDIKPSNIIFVNGAPKLADIGLVAGLDDTRSYVGTEGFIPPEGPGSPQADVYSLGKVLYEACTGRDRQDFPELPTRVEELGNPEQFLELNEVILHACKSECAKRYDSASNMHADLVVVSNGKSVKRLKLLEQRLTRLKRAGGIAGVVLAAALIFSYPTYQEWRLRLENRQRQVGEKVAYGLRAVEGGDPLTALPQFAEALRLDQSSKERALTYRLRFGAALAQTPKLTRVWSTPNEVESGQFNPDGNQVLVSQLYGPPLLYNISTGRRLTFPVKISHSESAAYSPDGRSIVVAGHETKVSVWDVVTGNLLLCLAHTNPVAQATFSLDGRYILTSCDNGFALLWSVSSGKIEQSFKHSTTNVIFSTFSHNGKLVATTGADNTCRLWNAADGSPAGSPLPHENWVSYAAFSPDDRLLVTASWDRTARVWDLTEHRRIPPDMDHADGVTSAEFSPDGQFIVTACADGTIHLWNTQTLQPRDGDSFLQHGARATRASIAPDGHRILTTCTDGSVRIWDLAGSDLPPPSAPVSFSANGARYLNNSNGTVTVRDSLSDTRIYEFTGLSLLTNHVQLSRNGQFLWGVAQAEGAPAGSPNRILVWNATTGQELSSNILFSNRVSGASLSDDGRRIVVFGGKIAQIWDVRLNKPLSPPLAHSNTVQSAVFNRDGSQVATRSANGVWVWDCFHDKPCFPPLQHPVEVSDFAFSPDGSLLATCCSDNTLDKYFAQIWDSGTGQPAGPRLMHGDGVLCVAFSPDGKRLVTGGEDFVAKQWDVQTGKTLPPALKHANQVKSVAFSPNGRWIVTVSVNIVQIWDSDSGDPVTPRLRNLVKVSRANFSPDGTTVVVCNENNTAWRWRLPVDHRPMADLSAIASLLSGGPDENQGAGPVLKPGHLEVIWQGLATNYSSDFTVSSDQVAAWHEFQAAEYEQNNKWFAAAFHLKQLLLLRPADQSLRERLAQAQEHLKTGD
jgi:WD40 repeat protein